MGIHGTDVQAEHHSKQSHPPYDWGRFGMLTDMFPKLPSVTTLFIDGVGHVDGEILETLLVFI